MKKLILPFLVALICLPLAFMSGCREKSTTEQTITSAEDNSSAEGEFASVFEIVDAQGNTDSRISGVAEKQSGIQEVTLKSDLLPDCATVSFDTTTKLLTIDFGTTNCLCNDGIYRRGTVYALFNGIYHKVGAQVTVTLNNYYVNDKHYEGTKMIKRIGDYKWYIIVTNAKVTSDAGTISWNSNRTIEKIAGYNTATIWDDVYKYTGSAYGTNRNGVNFTVTIDQALIRKILPGCWRNFVAGVLTVQNDKGSTMSVNYDPIGGEPCDKIADVTINGKTYRITLR